jgi:DNA polymerase elongation subunit (family B)
VTQTGRDLLKKMIDWLSKQGAKVIEVDTDGIYFVPPDTVDINGLQQGLAKELPSGIDVEFDEQFEAMFSYKAKNYALLTKDGDVIIKGGALKSRGLEKFQRVFLEEMIKLIMEGKSEAIASLRNDFEKKIRNQEWHIDMLMKTDTLQDSLEKYRAKIAGSARNRAAAYELALASGRLYKPGDQISYYIKSTAKKAPAYEAARLASDFDPQNRDENVDYYVAKLDELVKKFSGITATTSAPKQETLALD